MAANRTDSGEFMKFVSKFAAICVGFLVFQAHAGTISTFFTSSVPDPTLTLTPGQIYTVTATANASNGAQVQLNQIQLNPNLAGQFQIVGGTCNTTTAYSNTQTCTVNVQFLGNQPGNYSSVLQMSCQVVAAVGGYGIICASGPGTLGTMAQFVGAGVAGAVNTMGRGGLTALALALLALVSWATLRRRA
jgi:hypothetical protein